MESLTKKQQELVEKNHNLIYGFSEMFHVPIDDYYGVLAIGLCNAAKSYDVKKGKFSTFAYHCMKNEMIKEYCKDNKLKDSDYNDTQYECLDENLLLYGNIPYNKYVEKELYENILSLLTDKERKILYYLYSGTTETEIANKMNCSKQNISYFVKKIRMKIKDILNNKN